MNHLVCVQSNLHFLLDIHQFLQILISIHLDQRDLFLNVAPLINLFGLSDVANPLSAHVDYDHDQRVIALMAHGLGHADQAAIITERCTWLETRSE